jgi:antitoxin HigA-1
MTRMFNPAHPGEVLREFLPAALSVTEAARKLQVSRVQLSRILNGRSAVSAEMAIRIGKLTRTTPESWLTNQMQWDLWQARHNIASDVKRVTRLPALMQRSEMCTPRTTSRSMAGRSAVTEVCAPARGRTGSSPPARRVQRKPVSRG